MKNFFSLFFFYDRAHQNETQSHMKSDMLTAVGSPCFRCSYQDQPSIVGGQETIDLKFEDNRTALMKPL